MAIVHLSYQNTSEEETVLKQQQVLLAHLSELSVVRQSIMLSYAGRCLITMSQRMKLTATTVQRSN